MKAMIITTLAAALFVGPVFAMEKSNAKYIDQIVNKSQSSVSVELIHAVKPLLETYKPTKLPEAEPRKHIITLKPGESHEFILPYEMIPSWGEPTLIVKFGEEKPSQVQWKHGGLAYQAHVSWAELPKHSTLEIEDNKTIRVVPEQEKD